MVIIRVIGHYEPNIVMEYTPPPTDPEELAKVFAKMERVKRNSAYWNAHAPEFFKHHRGKCICIAGEEHFVADTPLEARVLGAAAHPEDDASFVHCIPKEKRHRV